MTDNHKADTSSAFTGMLLGAAALAVSGVALSRLEAALQARVFVSRGWSGATEPLGRAAPFAWLRY